MNNIPNRNWRRITVFVSALMIIVLLISLTWIFFGGLFTYPSQWIKVGETSQAGLEDWQQGEFFVGETWGTIHFQTQWGAPLPLEMYELSSEDSGCGVVYSVSRTFSVILNVIGINHHILVKQGFEQIWIQTTPGVSVVSRSFNETEIRLGFRFSPSPHWFAPLESVQTIHVNTSFSVFSNAATPYLPEFPFNNDTVIFSDGIPNEWGDIQNLSLRCAPQTTREFLGAIVNGSAFASETQLAFMFSYAQNLTAIKASYPGYQFSATFWTAIGWYSENRYTSYSGNFFQQDVKSNLIILVSDLQNGGFSTEDFSINNDQWDTELVFECYLTETQSMNFYNSSLAEDYTVSFSSELQWTSEIIYVNQPQQKDTCVNHVLVRIIVHTIERMFNGILMGLY